MTTPASPKPQNQLFYGDNLDVLRRFIKDETIDLCYIDPPFNSKRNYNQIYNNIGTEDRAQAQAFVDTWIWDDMANAGYAEILSNDKGAYTVQTVDLIKGLAVVLKKGSLLAYLVSMAQRVTEIHRVLKPTGSFYLHCDPTASHYLKILLDTIFVAGGGANAGDFQNEIAWCYTSGGKSSKRFAKKHDVILFYTKSKNYFFDVDKVRVPYSPKTLQNYKPGLKGSSYTADVVLNEGGKVPEDYWNIAVSAQSLAEQIYQEGQDPENVLERIADLDSLADKVLTNTSAAKEDYWNIAIASKSLIDYLGYPTQKPKALLERIILASCPEDGVILDAYCGCGTTVAVAERLKRRWIGIDITYQSISLILRRLEAQYGKAVLGNITLSGVPRDMAAAEALALKKDDRTRKEFEKWAVLTYSNNRAIINDKKGGDGGIDGVAYTQVSSDDNAKIVFQVKSGNVGRGDIAKLNSDRQRENAEIGVFLTLKPPTKGMNDEAKGFGDYKHPLMGRNYPRIEIVTVQEMIENDKRLDTPMTLEVLKKAKAVTDDTQVALFED